MTATAPTLDAALVAGLKRLKLAKVRAIAPEVLQTARTQGRKPEGILRVLADAEIAARDNSNARMRLRAAGFPIRKTLDEFNFGLSSIPQSTFDYLTGLEWIRAAENLCLVCPAGTGKSHLLPRPRPHGGHRRPQGPPLRGRRRRRESLPRSR